MSENTLVNSDYVSKETVKVVLNDIGKLHCLDLSIHINGINYPYYLVHDEDPPFDSLYSISGKYFLFIKISETEGYKILHKQIDENPIDAVHRVMGIQSLLASSGFSLKCFPYIYKFELTDSRITKICYGYKTGFAKKTKEPENNISIREKWFSDLIKVFNLHGINRKDLIRESLKAKNYVYTKDGYRLIDIDIRYKIGQYSYLELDLRNDIVSKSNFPFDTNRRKPYQSVEDIKGTRKMRYRYKFMKLPKRFYNKTVLDIGCNLGMVCAESMNRGAYSADGLDFREETIEVGRKYMKTRGYESVNLWQVDISTTGIDVLEELFSHKKFDYVFALSILKHVDSKKLFDIINRFTNEICWFEAHNKNKYEDIEKMLKDNLDFTTFEFLGHTEDRGTRPVFKLTK